MLLNTTREKKQTESQRNDMGYSLTQYNMVINLFCRPIQIFVKIIIHI